MATALKDLLVKLSLNNSDFNKKLKDSVNNISKATKQIGETLSSAGKNISTFITIPATIAGTAFLKLASDANEANDKLEAFYGTSAPEVKKSLERMGDSLGRNATELKNYATSFGEVFTSIGLTDEKSAEYSQTLIQLGLDVGSFRNVADAKVMDAFASAIQGQTRGLKQLGISLSDTTIKEKAFEMGLITAGQELDERAKTMAIMSLLQKKFAKDSGDLANSQGTFENVLKRFNAQLKTMGEVLGQAIIPFATKLMEKLQPLIDVVMRLNEGTKTFSIVATGIAIALGGLLIVVGQLAIALIAIWPTITAIGAFLAGPFLASVGALLIPILALGVAAVSVIGTWDDLVEFAKMMWDDLTGLFKAGADWIISIWPDAFKISGEKIDSIFRKMVQIAKDFVVNIINALVVFPRWLANFLVKNVADAVNDIIGYLNEFESITGLLFNEVSFTKFNENVAVTFEDLVDTARWGFDNVKSAGIKAFSYIADFATKQWSVFSDNFIKGIDRIKGTLSGIFLTPAKPKEGGTERKSTFLDDVGFQFEGADEDANTPALDIPPPKISLWDRWAEHIKVTVEDVYQTMVGLFDSMTSGFGDAINSMIFEGDKFSEVMKVLMVDLAKQVISALIKLGLQYIATSIMGIFASKAQGLAQIGTAAAVTYANTYSAISAIPIIGPALAPGAASAASAAMSGTALGLLALADGGITQGPTNALIGEAGQEAVIPLDRLDSMMGAREQTIMINLDGRQIAKSVIKHAPREIRLNTGVLM